MSYATVLHALDKIGDAKLRDALITQAPVPRRLKMKWRTIKALRALPKRIGDFSRWMFPVIGRMAQQDLIQQLVQVQPMALPSARAFYMDFVGPASLAPFQRRAHVPPEEMAFPLDELPGVYADLDCEDKAKTDRRLAAATWGLFTEGGPLSPVLRAD